MSTHEEPTCCSAILDNMNERMANTLVKIGKTMSTGGLNLVFGDAEPLQRPENPNRFYRIAEAISTGGYSLLSHKVEVTPVEMPDPQPFEQGT